MLFRAKHSAGVGRDLFQFTRERTRGLRVDSAARALLKGVASVPAIIPAIPRQSFGSSASAQDDVSAMPPDNHSIRHTTVADFAACVKAGAKWPSATVSFAAVAALGVSDRCGGVGGVGGRSTAGGNGTPVRLIVSSTQVSGITG